MQNRGQDSDLTGHMGDFTPLYKYIRFAVISTALQSNWHIRRGFEPQLVSSAEMSSCERQKGGVRQLKAMRHFS